MFAYHSDNDDGLRHRSRAGETWWDRLPEHQPGDSWFDRLGRRREEPSAPPPLASKPTNPISARARGVVQSLPRQSRKPGGRLRAGQRSGDRVIPVPTVEVLPDLVLTVFQRRWRGKLLVTMPWRVRALAVIAVAMSLPKGATIETLCQLREDEVLALRMPRPAWRWVVRWLQLRRGAFREAAEHQPWLEWVGSRGMPRQVAYAATRTFARAGLPGWRVGKLLRSSWLAHQQPMRFPTHLPPLRTG